jgi:Tol biopolymer transport system component
MEAMSIRKALECITAMMLLTLGAGFLSFAGGIEPVVPANPALGSPNTGGGDSITPIISPDGRYVLFASTANNLVANGTNGPFASRTPPRLNLFIRDRTNETTTLVTVNQTGTGGGDGDSFPRELSTNGQFALFESGADNLVADDNNNAVDVFVRDLVHGRSRLVSTNLSGGSANALSRDSVMTPDGRYVAFSSLASNLVAGDTNGIADIFVTDLQTGLTTLASPGSTGPGSCDSPEITPDGHYVAFSSTATNLVAGAPTLPGIYVRDLIGLTTILASTNSNASEPPYNHRISDDGQYVAFEVNPTTRSTTGIIMRYDTQAGIFDTVAANAVANHNAFSDFRSLEMTPDGQTIAFVGTTNGSMAVYVWNAASGITTLASPNTNQMVSTNALADWPQMDTSGRYVSFLSTATDLVTNVVTNTFHLYVYDLTNAAMQLVDVDTKGAGSPGDLLSIPRMTPDGKTIAFDSTGGNLVSGDDNLSYDVFARNLTTESTELISVRNSSLSSCNYSGRN